MFGIQVKTYCLRKDEFWALDNISFNLKKGESLGIIGVNGSGKSTLLRLITGIFPPDMGRIAIRGKVGALIAVGAGFHPHMTGRENIYLNGTILGMTRKELNEKMDEIISFADIGDFLDAPVNTYSSGMRVRLGFAIAVHCEPDILLVDEILSVGDLAFRNKSMRKMAEFREKANALIFISHNLEQVRNLCSKVYCY
jgi:lipopolysaccharide transport system ATP-binding protein